jgi:hypothetical protein
MKKHLQPLHLFIFIFLLLVFSCEKDILSDNTCNVDNPLEQLDWLKDTVQNIGQSNPEWAKYYLISMAKYKGETVFIESNCNPLANSVFPVLNCSGELLGVLGEIPMESLSDRNVIWRSVNSACQ